MSVSLCNSLHIQCSAVHCNTDYSNKKLKVQNENFSLFDGLDVNYMILFNYLEEDVCHV